MSIKSNCIDKFIKFMPISIFLGALTWIIFEMLKIFGIIQS